MPDQDATWHRVNLGQGHPVSYGVSVPSKLGVICTYFDFLLPQREQNLLKMKIFKRYWCRFVSRACEVVSEYDNCNDIQMTLEDTGYLKIWILLDSWVNCAKKIGRLNLFMEPYSPPGIHRVRRALHLQKIKVLPHNLTLNSAVFLAFSVTCRHHRQTVQRQSYW